MPQIEYFTNCLQWAVSNKKSPSIYQDTFRPFDRAINQEFSKHFIVNRRWGRETRPHSVKQRRPRNGAWCVAKRDAPSVTKHDRGCLRPVSGQRGDQNGHPPVLKQPHFGPTWPEVKPFEIALIFPVLHLLSFYQAAQTISPAHELRTRQGRTSPTSRFLLQASLLFSRTRTAGTVQVKRRGSR